RRSRFPASPFSAPMASSSAPSTTPRPCCVPPDFPRAAALTRWWCRFRRRSAMAPGCSPRGLRIFPGTKPMTRFEKDKMLAGELYNAAAPDIQAEQQAAMRWLARYNAMLTASAAERLSVLRERLAAVGDASDIRPPFYCDYGFNISLGTGVFLNFNCVVLDVVGVSIGDKTQIGPGVQILTADHPRDPAERHTSLECGQPIAIGRNVGIGGAAVILPGVSIGDDAIIGAGAVVTRDVPPGATVAGNPARPLARRKD